MNGKNCPACGKDVGFWSVFSSGWPTRIKCPHCRVNVVYENSLGVTLAMIVALAAAAFAARAGAEVDGSFVRGRFILIFLASAVPIEALATFFLRARRTLRKRQ